MSLSVRPHDLLWLRNASALLACSADWLTSQWHPGLPVVVRRDIHTHGLIPVGVRGARREQRAAGWVNPQAIVRVVTPESLTDIALLQRSPLAHMAPVQAALRLAQFNGARGDISVSRDVAPHLIATAQTATPQGASPSCPLAAAAPAGKTGWPWRWGITGSVGYALATGLPTLHADSDLDLTLRAPQRLAQDDLAAWQQAVAGLACRVDTQVETPHGAFALAEWLRDGRTLLKTNRGPLPVSDPWNPEAE